MMAVMMRPVVAGGMRNTNAHAKERIGRVMMVFNHPRTFPPRETGVDSIMSLGRGDGSRLSVSVSWISSLVLLDLIRVRAEGRSCFGRGGSWIGSSGLPMVW